MHGSGRVRMGLARVPDALPAPHRRSCAVRLPLPRRDRGGGTCGARTAAGEPARPGSRALHAYQHLCQGVAGEAVLRALVHEAEDGKGVVHRLRGRVGTKHLPAWRVAKPLSAPYTQIPDVVKFQATKLLTGNWQPYPITMSFAPPNMVESLIGLSRPGVVERVSSEGFPRKGLQAWPSQSRGCTPVLWARCADALGAPRPPPLPLLDIHVAHIDIPHP